MPQPFLSVIVPAYNEALRIEPCVSQLTRELNRLGHPWELLVLDDGSSDATVAIARAAAAADDRIQVLELVHAGKGAAIRRGLQAARGRWIFMADADLSMPPGEIGRFLAAVSEDGALDIVIGSREAEGALRVGEPWVRHAIGRAFNYLAQALAVPGIEDTQCGFKLLSARAATVIAPQLTLDGFAFDVELLFVARRAGFVVRELGIRWHYRGDSRVRFGRGATAFWDILRVRWNDRRGQYGSGGTVAAGTSSGTAGGSPGGMRRWAYVLALASALSFAYDLAHIPVQVSDSLGVILNVRPIPSAAEAFRRTLSLDAGYFRPLRVAQIKAVLDGSRGEYTLAFRGVHLVLLFAAIFLFVHVLRVTTTVDFAAAAFALATFTGLHTFLGTLREAYPINHFLEMVVFTLAALALTQGRANWARDAGAALLFIAAALVLESGLLVWVVVAAAWVAGMRGVSGRGVLITTCLLIGYLAVRFVVLDKGLPGLDARSTGFLLDVLEPAELEQQFGTNRLPFYAYNVASSVSSVLFSEPRAGVWAAVRDYLRGDVSPRVVVSIVASLFTTMLIAVAAIRRWRQRDALDDADRFFVVFAAVLVANAGLSSAYTKDETLSFAAAFYPLPAYAAVRSLLVWGGARRHGMLVWLLTAVLFVASAGWMIRVAGHHAALRGTAFVTRNDWASLPSNFDDAGAGREVVDRLRSDALNRRVGAPPFAPRWQQRWLYD